MIRLPPNTLMYASAVQAWHLHVSPANRLGSPIARTVEPRGEKSSANRRVPGLQGYAGKISMAKGMGSCF